jgi:hypothetical protein
MFLDVPGNNVLVQPTFAVAGWAVDLGTTSGTGVATVHVWALPVTGAAPIFLGAANMGVQRPDIAAYFGRAELAASGFGLSASLPSGTYDIVAFAFSTVFGNFNNSHAARVTVVWPTPNPKMFIDVPGPSQFVSSPFQISGWAVDLGSWSGPGASVVHVWAYPVTGAPPIFVGAALVNNSRPDVGAHFGHSRFSTAGYSLQGNLPGGTYNLVVFAFSTVSGTFNQAAVVPIVVQ